MITKIKTELNGSLKKVGALVLKSVSNVLPLTTHDLQKKILSTQKFNFGLVIFF